MAAARYLPSSGVRVDGDLAGASTVAVDRGGHFLPGEKSHDFLLRRDKLSGLGPLQRLADEMGKHFDLRAGEKLSDPGKTPEGRNWMRPDFAVSVVEGGSVKNRSAPFEVKLEVA